MATRTTTVEHSLIRKPAVEVYADHLEARLKYAQSILRKVARKKGDISNGYCRWCGGHRLFGRGGRPRVCENKFCLSRQVAKALQKP
jgi:hypothetical protein